MKDVLSDFMLYCTLALAGVLARFGMNLGGDPPPDDPELYRKWRHKQVWLVTGELLTIPAFGASWIAIVHQWHPSIEIVVVGCMFSGAAGFGFWLDAFQRLVNRRVENA